MAVEDMASIMNKERMDEQRQGYRKTGENLNQFQILLPEKLHSAELQRLSYM